MQREIIEKQRVVIQFLQSLDVSPSKTLIQLKKSFGDQTLSRTAVFEWHRRFKEGRESTSDDERCGRPELLAKKREMVKSMLDRDRRVSTREVAEECDIGVATAYKLITEEFKMTKVCARWIPRLLDDNQMKDRVNKSLNFLRSYRREGDRFLQRIITTDETWFHLFDPETKQQSMVWKTSSSPPPKKARVTKSKGKFMFIVFMDNNGVILTHAVPAGVTVNAAYYSKVVRRDMVQALRKKRPGMEENIENVLLHQDNAPAHRARYTELELDVLGIGRLEHAPYSPDLAPLDFALFPAVKAQLRGIRFDDLESLRCHVQTIMSSFDKQWFQTVYTSWVRRHERCVQAHGRYFEKE